LAFRVLSGTYENVVTGNCLSSAVYATTLRVPGCARPAVVPVSVPKPNQKLSRSKDLTPELVLATAWA
jgi:hypothetical protein